MNIKEIEIALVIKQYQNIIGELQISLERTTTIIEILNYVHEYLKLQTNPLQWTCYSESKQQFFPDLNQQIGGFLQSDRFIIDTTSNKQQSIPKFGNQQQQIKLSINVLDGFTTRNFHQFFSVYTILDQVAASVLTYMSLNSELAAIDLFISGQDYNKPTKRAQTLQMLQLKNEQIIDAKIRWYGGRKIL